MDPRSVRPALAVSVLCLLAGCGAVTPENVDAGILSDGGSVVPSSPECGEGRILCGAECVDASAEPNCGACGKTCSSGEVCSAGACVAIPAVCPSGGCPSGTFCDLNQNRCVPGCLQDSQCTTSQSCEARRCRACPAAKANCNRTDSAACEVDLSSDRQNCGACGKVCSADRACTSGACTCTGGKLDCAGSCVDSQTDVGHCGSCGNACPDVEHGAPTCTAGTCGITCEAGYHLCGGACVSNMSLATCGGACQPCPVPANGVATCDGTACGFTCNTGYVPSGDKCVLNCKTSGCTNTQYCDVKDGLCKTGCERHDQCSSVTVCDRVNHKCVATVDPSCPAGYTNQGTCTNGNRFCVFSGVTGIVVYKFKEPCPANTVEHGTWYCSDVTRVCIPK